MLGMCEMERGNADTALAHFEQGLELPALTPPARHALQFELGGVYEARGLDAEACEWYQAIHAEDPSFRDVAERVQRLGGSVRATPRLMARPASRPAVAARKVAAHSTSTPATAGTRGGSSPDPGPEPSRKNRKIGFV